eukprot:g2651.t1
MAELRSQNASAATPLRHRAAALSASKNSAARISPVRSTTASSSSASDANSIKARASYRRLKLIDLPPHLYAPDVPREKWIEYATLMTPDTRLDELGADQEFRQKVPLLLRHERMVGMPLYLAWNVLPALGPVLAVLNFMFWGNEESWLGCFFWWCGALAVGVPAILLVYELVLLHPLLRKMYPHLVYPLRNSVRPGDFFRYQYLYSEHNSVMDNSLQIVFPDRLLEDIDAVEKKCGRPVIFCVIPHGVVPLAITAYPVWSKLFNSRVCRWTVAPILLKIPLVSSFMRRVGAIPASAGTIEKNLRAPADVVLGPDVGKEDNIKRESKPVDPRLPQPPHNIGIVLDGIAGMFETEKTAIKNRKGIVKIALRTKTPIVPVYVFGHHELYTVLQDPFGILAKLSTAANVSILPFLGRWFIPYGPTKRGKALAACCGELIRTDLGEEGGKEDKDGAAASDVGKAKVDPEAASDPTRDEIDFWHGKLLQEYERTFETHKKNYKGWEDKKLQFV